MQRAHRQQSNNHYVFKVPGSGKVWWGISLAAGTVVLLMVLLAGEKSFFKVLSLYKEKNHLEVRIEEIKQENEKMIRQIEQLKSDSKSVERIAREELGMVRPDEIVYRFIPAKRVNRKKESK